MNRLLLFREVGCLEGEKMINEKQALTQIIHLSQEIAQYKDVDILLERILTLAREFVNAEAGSIYIKEDGQLNFSYTQNEILQRKLAPGKKLVYSTFSIPIDDRSIAGHAAHTGEMLNITDVYHLPPQVPYSFNREYDERTGFRTQSVLTFPLKISHGNIIGVLQLINARNDDNTVRAFSKEEEPLIMHFANNAAVAIERAQMTRALILRVIKMAEMRDPKETGPHVNRVGSYAAEIYEVWASRRGVPHEEIQKHRDVLRMGAMLHDVGKVAISDTILKKPARFEPEEYEIMKQHTYLGARLFSERYSDFDEAAFIISLNHHERWDGKGYPGHIDPMTGALLPGYETNGKFLGKKAEEIPPFGRIVAIADVYDALSCRRVYKEAWDESRVLETMRSDAGTHFDPEMIDAFFESLDVLRHIADRYPGE